MPNTEKENKLKDIEDVDFGGNLEEAISSMEILVMLIEITDDSEVLAAIKRRMKEGVEVLKKFNYNGFNNIEIEK